VLAHAPLNWQETVGIRKLSTLINRRDRQYVVVLAADIRKSTVLMNEAISQYSHAQIISTLVDFLSDKIREQNGWFDKFTGDGFLGYWFYEDSKGLKDALTQAFEFTLLLNGLFENNVIPLLKKNSRNFPADSGIAFGIDRGSASLVTVKDSLTIMGRPVVGAVRMVSVAKRGELLANVRVGTKLIDWKDRSNRWQELRVASVQETERETKEHKHHTLYSVVLSPKRQKKAAAD
jgi:class 3 adenylate cyclase